MPSFLIKHGSVIHGGKRCVVGDTIEISDSDAKALSEAGIGSIVDPPVEVVADTVVEPAPVVEETTVPESEPAPEVEPDPVPRRKRQS